MLPAQRPEELIDQEVQHDKIKNSEELRALQPIRWLLTYGYVFPLSGMSARLYPACQPPFVVMVGNGPSIFFAACRCVVLLPLARFFPAAPLGAAVVASVVAPALPSSVGPLVGCVRVCCLSSGWVLILVLCKKQKTKTQ